MEENFWLVPNYNGLSWNKLLEQEREAALAYSTSEAALSPSRNLHDSSLPTGWRVQRIQSSIYFFSPLGERLEDYFFLSPQAPLPRFESREAVVERLVSEGASADVVEKVQAGQRWERLEKYPKLM